MGRIEAHQEHIDGPGCNSLQPRSMDLSHGIASTLATIPLGPLQTFDSHSQPSRLRQPERNSVWPRALYPEIAPWG